LAQLSSLVMVQKLPSKAIYSTLKEGRRICFPLFVAHINNRIDSIKYQIITPFRCGNAVIRHRIKRRTKEAFVNNLRGQNKTGELLIVANKKILEAKSKDLSYVCSLLLNKL